MMSLLFLLIKCADLSNCARENAVNREWVSRLLHEFWEQGDMEKAIHGRCSPNLERCVVHTPMRTLYHYTQNIHTYTQKSERRKCPDKLLEVSSSTPVSVSRGGE